MLENPVLILKVCRNWHGYYYKYIQDSIIEAHTIFSLLSHILTSFLNIYTSLYKYLILRLLHISLLNLYLNTTIYELHKHYTCKLTHIHIYVAICVHSHRLRNTYTLLTTSLSFCMFSLNYLLVEKTLFHPVLFKNTKTLHWLCIPVVIPVAKL